MHCSIDHGFTIKYQITAHRPCIWHIAPPSARSCWTEQRTACPEVIPYNGAICPAYRQLLWLTVVHTAESEHSLACCEQSLLEIEQEKSSQDITMVQQWSRNLLLSAFFRPLYTKVYMCCGPKVVRTREHSTVWFFEAHTIAASPNCHAQLPFLVQQICTLQLSFLVFSHNCFCCSTISRSYLFA